MTSYAIQRYSRAKDEWYDFSFPAELECDYKSLEDVKS